MDDQVKRCKRAEEEGWGLVHLPGNVPIEEQISTLLQMEIIPKASENGVDSVVKLIMAS